MTDVLILIASALVGAASVPLAGFSWLGSLLLACLVLVAAHLAVLLRS